MSAEPTRWRSIAITAYGPTVLVAVGQSAILPLVALSARELGASVGIASFIVALIGLGQLVGDLPAGALAVRIGEKRALIAACALDALALMGAFLATSVVLLAVAITVTGVAGAVFGLARQAYLTEAIPLQVRARALSTLGGTFRVGLFIAYLVLISLLPDLRRVFQYHAAEHKAINAYEAGDELEPERVQQHSLIHPRCGTAFLLWVMVIAIFVFAFFGQPVWYWLIASRILLLPVIAGIAYELIRFAGKHTGNRILMTLLAPGLWLQRLTTREPTLDQLEVSIRALKDVLQREGRLDPAERKVEVMA